MTARARTAPSPVRGDERRSLQRAYQEAPKYGGVFLITNLINGRTLLGSSVNLHGPLNKHRFMLSIGGHFNVALQRDYDAHGGAAFRFEIVAQFEHKPDDPTFDLEGELSLLEQIWIERVDPFSGRGYNRGSRLRE